MVERYDFMFLSYCLYIVFFFLGDIKHKKEEHILNIFWVMLDVAKVFFRECWVIVDDFYGRPCGVRCFLSELRGARLWTQDMPKSTKQMPRHAPPCRKCLGLCEASVSRPGPLQSLFQVYPKEPKLRGNRKRIGKVFHSANWCSSRMLCIHALLIVDVERGVHQQIREVQYVTTAIRFLVVFLICVFLRFARVDLYHNIAPVPFEGNNLASRCFRSSSANYGEQQLSLLCNAYARLEVS